MGLGGRGGEGEYINPRFLQVVSRKKEGCCLVGFWRLFSCAEFLEGIRTIHKHTKSRNELRILFFSPSSFYQVN